MKWNKQDANDIGNSSSVLACSFETDKFNLEQRLAVYLGNTHCVCGMSQVKEASLSAE